METVILGISPGTRTTALVVIQNKRILDMYIKDTKGSYQQCIPAIVQLLNSVIEKYQVQAISMKVVPSYQSTDVLTDLYSEIRQVACNTGIFLSTFKMENLRKLSGDNHPNKESLFRHLALQFPEVEVQYHKVHKNRNRKIMEALACAVTA